MLLKELVYDIDKVKVYYLEVDKFIQVTRQRVELQREYDRKFQEMKEVFYRMKEDCYYQVELERLVCY